MVTEPNEYTFVELPFIEQLKSMGWQHTEGSISVPYLTERESFREVLLTQRLKDAIRRINLDDDGNPWLDDTRINQAVGTLTRLGAHRLMESNQAATELLLTGTTVEGDANQQGGRGQTVHFIDFDHPERNDFLVINQFRVDPPWAIGDKDFIIPDIVLFVNGIPLVVVECKSPNITNPMEEGIAQLLRYSNQRDWFEEDEGAERLFHYNQFTVSTYRSEARVGTISASYEHYMEWKDTSPLSIPQVAEELGVDSLNSQQTLIAGMLRKEHILDIVRNFTLFQQVDDKTIKIAGRYHQFRAVQKAIRRLQHGQTKAQHGETDQRGGVVWHTQGSGKSLTMVFLIRKMRTLPNLRRFKVVAVTDRKDLDKQLRDTAALTGETLRRAMSTEKLKEILSEDGPDLVFAMIQKYQDRDLETEVIEPSDQMARSEIRSMVAETPTGYKIPGRTFKIPKETEAFPVLNESEDILVLIDEAHRSQTNTLHANLMKSLPNCAKIGFTGTPIMASDRKRTQEIFGSFIDQYTIKQSEADGSTVPILYEGKTAQGAVSDERSLDQLFEDMFMDKTPKELEAIKAKYATKGNVLEATQLIEAKAQDMLRHYVDKVMPEGLKAQLVSTSRRAAVRYQAALEKARQKLVDEIEALDPSLLALSDDDLESQDEMSSFLVRAHAHLDTIKRLEFAAIISGSVNDDPSWKEWSDGAKVDARITRFKKHLFHQDPSKQDSLAFLCVKSMLLTGFDAPVEGVMYLDRFTHGHELLQAIARVNRNYREKHHGLVVDYYGVGQHLKEALAVYTEEDVLGALVNIKDELPILSDRHQRVLAVFHDKGITDIANIDACIDLLRDIKIRADFVVKLKLFLESLNIVMPRPEALTYVRDAKILGFINNAAANLYRDSQLNLMGVGHKVRKLIDDHIISKGIDPKIPPISILDANFEQAVEAHVSNRTKASEMEHAARYEIRVKFTQDPVYYKKLSERLEDILIQFQHNWDHLVSALRELTKDVREGRSADETGLDPQTQAPFLSILSEEISSNGDLPQERLNKLAALTVEMVEHIRREIRVVDFWRNSHAQTVLRGWIVRLLDDHDAVPFARQEAAADRIVELAKALHARLTS